MPTPFSNALRSTCFAFGVVFRSAVQQFTGSPVHQFTRSAAHRFTRSAVVLLALVTTAHAQTWHASAYHDITPGKSRRAAVEKAFGKPDEVRKPSLTAFAGDLCCQELVYRNKAENGGDLYVAVQKSGTVVYIVDEFKSAMPRSTAYHKYGKDWHSHTYSSAKCAAVGGSAPLYLDPAGSIELVEYPDKGLLFWPSDDAYDFYGAVYVARAPGLAKAPPCVKKSSKK